MIYYILIEDDYNRLFEGYSDEWGMMREGGRGRMVCCRQAGVPFPRYMQKQTLGSP